MTAARWPSKPETMTAQHVHRVLENLDGLTRYAFFIGMGWPEGASYSQDRAYVKGTLIPVLQLGKDLEFSDSRSSAYAQRLAFYLLAQKMALDENC